MNHRSLRRIILALSLVPMGCVDPEPAPVRGDKAQERSEVAKPAGYAAIHVERSTPIIQSWKELRSGDPVARLASVTPDREWLNHVLIQEIGGQSGKWDVWSEAGHTVFRIYPYMSAGEAKHPPCYQGIVIKVNVHQMSAEALVQALRKGDKEPVLVEFSIFGKDIHVYSPKAK